MSELLNSTEIKLINVNGFESVLNDNLKTKAAEKLFLTHQSDDIFFTDFAISADCTKENKRHPHFFVSHTQTAS